MLRESSILAFIRSLGRHIQVDPPAGFKIPVGLENNDDCAVIELPGSPYDLVVGSDFVRGEEFHLFRVGRVGWRELGNYLVVANTSDLAAMGAHPLGLLSVIRYSSAMIQGDVEAAATGIAETCVRCAIPLLGGDTGSYGKSVLSATALGIVPHGKALLRSKGKPGDVLFTTGPVGLSAAAVRHFTDPRLRLVDRDEKVLLAGWARETPDLRQGQLLVENDLSQCAMDTSDGFAATCRELSRASSVVVRIRREALPIPEIVERIANESGADPLELALGDSCDCNLVFAVAPPNRGRVESLFRERSWFLREVGRLEPTAGTEPYAYLDTPSGSVDLPGQPWNHEVAVTQSSAQPRWF